MELKEDGTELAISSSTGSIKGIKEVCANSPVWDSRRWNLCEETGSKEEQNDIKNDWEGIGHERSGFDT